jgi:outer membrane protein assembly factor BamB
MNLQEKTQRVRRIIIISAVFCSLVSLLLMLNYMQIRGSKPLESRAMELLVERLSAEPNNEILMEEIRQLDLLARKAYFNSIWQIRTGAYLLIVGVVVLVISLRSYFSLQFAIHRPREEMLSERKNRLLAQRWIAISGVGILLLAALSAYLSADHIRQFDTVKLTMNDNTPDDGIERVTISATDSFTDTTVSQTEEIEALDDVEEDTLEAEGSSSTPSQPTVQALTQNAVQQNFNSFRGPWGNGRSNHQNIPVDWDGASGKNILWKVEIPVHGYNTPIIWGDRLYFSGANPSRRVVYCMDRHTGRMIWERDVNNIPGSPATPPGTTDDTGLAAPTLTTDGNLVFALFGTGDIIAFDLEGNRRWAQNIGVPRNHYGHSSSLLTWENKLFVQYDTQDGSRVMALDNTTGQTVWETPRTSDVSWASPILANVDGQFQLVLLGNPDFAAYDIKTGRELWNIKCMSGEVGVSPAYGGGLVYAANEYATMIAVNPATGQKVWEDRYYLPEVSSPVYHDGYLYIATTFAVLASFEASTGTFNWEFDGDDSFYSSPMIADGKLYVFDTTGKAYIFKPGKEPELIATPSLGERVYSTPVFANGRLYIRGNKHLYCIGTN